MFNRGIINCHFSSRDEIALWKEKQIQVAREEARVKESLAKLAEESKGGQLTKRATNRGEASVADTKVISDLICHLLERPRDFYSLLESTGIVNLSLI